MVTMKRALGLLVLSLPVLVGAALVDCVSDDPSPAATSDAAIQDAALVEAAPSDAGGDAAPADPCAGSVNCPSRQNPGHLQLWLRGDLGVTCDGGRVHTWHDQSGHNRDASTPSYPDGGAAYSPQCGVSTLNGRNVISFTKPSGSLAPYIDEVFNVELGFLVGKQHTIYVVHRPVVQTSGNYFLGLVAAQWTYPTGTACTTFPPTNDGTLDLAMQSQSDGGPDFTLVYNAHQVCHHSGIESMPFAWTPGQPTFDTFIFSGVQTLRADGVEVFADSEGENANGISGDAGNLNPGVIGRESDDGLKSGDDLRYAGDIAEIIVYDTALTTELSALDAYVKTTWGLP